MTLTMTRPIQDPIAVLARMTPGQFRRELAIHAGANPAQLTTLTAFEQRLGTHVPAYDARPDGSVQATYTARPTGTVSALVSPDGTLKVTA